MTTANPNDRKHTHEFDQGNPLAERNTRWAVLLTIVTMVVEILAGWKYNSMALLADGWHMSSHALALGLAILAYATARRYSEHPRFCFGTWKIEILGGYTSAIFLIGIAALMFFHSIERLLTPIAIQYDQAIFVAAVGLLVNVVCAWLLKDGHHHGHSHHHEELHETTDHSHHDLNLRAAYLHVLTDAMTSLFAIIALFGGKLWEASWLDPSMGIVGAVLVAIWAVGLVKEAAAVLLDAEMDKPISMQVQATLNQELPTACITDFHLWRVGKSHYACVISITSKEPLSPDQVKSTLLQHRALQHVTVEVNRD